MRFTTIFLTLVASTVVQGFVPTTSRLINNKHASFSPQTQLYAGEIVQTVDVETARISFFLWFFGASGGAGIARSSFPRLYKASRYIQQVKDKGPTLGGEKIGINPIVSFLTGYPDLPKADLMQILNNKMSVQQIIDKYPVEGNFFAAKGYLTFTAFEQANANANPLATRAIFDTFNTSNDVSVPDVAQNKINSYKESLDSFEIELLKSKLVGISAIFVLLFLLGLADVVAFGHAKDGWFPTWPGLSNLPGSLFDSEIGLTSIPKFWI